MVQTDTICNMCGTGCSLTIETRDGEGALKFGGIDGFASARLNCFDVIGGDLEAC